MEKIDISKEYDSLSPNGKEILERFRTDLRNGDSLLAKHISKNILPLLRGHFSQHAFKRSLINCLQGYIVGLGASLTDASIINDIGNLTKWFGVFKSIL